MKRAKTGAVEDIKAKARAGLAAQKETILGTKAIAGRMVQAEIDFLDILMTLGGLTRSQAERVFEVFRKHRVLKRDLGIGRYTVIDGRLLDRDVIRRAAGLEK